MRLSVYRLIIALLTGNNILLFVYLLYSEEPSQLKGYFPGAKGKESMDTKIQNTPKFKTDDNVGKANKYRGDALHLEGVSPPPSKAKEYKEVASKLKTHNISVGSWKNSDDTVNKSPDKVQNHVDKVEILSDRVENSIDKREKSLDKAEKTFGYREEAPELKGYFHCGDNITKVQILPRMKTNIANRVERANKEEEKANINNTIATQKSNTKNNAKVKFRYKGKGSYDGDKYKQMDDGMCVQMGFSRVPLPKTALASFPGSGNTWLRHLVEQLTGIHTGSVYHDGALRKRFNGEGRRDTSVIGIKTHGSMQDLRTNKTWCERAVILMRDPYEAILSEYNRQYSYSHTGTAQIFGIQWIKYLDGYIEYWYKQHIIWFNNGVCDIMFISYKDLKTDLKRQLEKLVDFFNVYPLTEEHLRCILSKSDGNFKRQRKTAPPPMDELYDVNARARIDSYLEELKEIIWNKFGQRVSL